MLKLHNQAKLVFSLLYVSLICGNLLNFIVQSNCAEKWHNLTQIATECPTVFLLLDNRCFLTQKSLN